ncbi:MAG: ATP-grasp domain-containing protein [Deltaproteobacteria bacterium]|nr:ATP-grasp domain-containing protein [Deltaproteobacteria bacterium]
MTKKTVNIIYNDDGSDRQVFAGTEILLDNISKTASEVQEALKRAGFKTSITALKVVKDRGLDDFIKGIRDAEDGIIFNLCEAAFGKSSHEMHVAALLELYGLKFTGSGPLTLGLALDKGITKDLLTSRDIMTPEHCVLREPPTKLKRNMQFPVIVKPLREDASLGIDSGAVVHKMKDFKKRVEFIINTFKQPAIVEEYIDGREFNVAVLGNGRDVRALPPAELLFVDFPEGVPRICSYEAKWISSSPLYKKTVPQCPADIPESLRDELQGVALKAYEIMGCRDYARVDMRLGEDGNIKVLEVNPNPDISSDAGLARAAMASGMDYKAFIAEIVNIAWARYPASLMPAETRVSAG